MDKEKQIQYYAKIVQALESLFDEESDCYIDIYDDRFSANDFFHTLGTRVPQMIFSKLTTQQIDPLGFNHVLNRLIVQDTDDNKKG